MTNAGAIIHQNENAIAAPTSLPDHADGIIGIHTPNRQPSPNPTIQPECSALSALKPCHRCGHSRLAHRIYHRGITTLVCITRD